MLGKLLKYDFKGVARYMLPLYGLLLISTCGMKLTLELSDNMIVNIFRTLFIIAYVISLIVIITGSMIVLILRFYRNLMSDEGYLSFTLPVTPTAHLASKLINGLIWVIFTTLTVILSVLLLTAGHISSNDWREGIAAFQHAISELNGIGIHSAQIWLALIYGFFAISVGFPIIVYFCICAGQLFGSHRVLGAFVVYFCWYVFSQVCNLAILVSTGKALGTSLETMTALETSVLTNGLNRMLLTSFVFSFVCYVGLFFATRYLMARKLNLE